MGSGVAADDDGYEGAGEGDDGGYDSGCGLYLDGEATGMEYELTCRGLGGGSTPP